MSGSIMITLKQVGNCRWRLYAPKGHTLGPEFHGNKFAAAEWARIWISGFHNWTLTIEGNKDEKTN